jgi:hypothetical protein
MKQKEEEEKIVVVLISHMIGDWNGRIVCKEDMEDVVTNTNTIDGIMFKVKELLHQ